MGLQLVSLGIHADPFEKRFWAPGTILGVGGSSSRQIAFPHVDYANQKPRDPVSRGGEMRLGQTDTNKYALLWDLVGALFCFCISPSFCCCSASHLFSASVPPLSPSLTHVMLWTVEIRYFIWNNRQASFLTTATRKLWQAKRQSCFYDVPFSSLPFLIGTWSCRKSLICVTSLSFQLVKLLNMFISHLQMTCNGWLP